MAPDEDGLEDEEENIDEEDNILDESMWDNPPKAHEIDTFYKKPLDLNVNPVTKTIKQRRISADFSEDAN